MQKLMVNNMHNYCNVKDSLYDVFCTWSIEIVLKLPMKIDVERYYNNSASICSGHVCIKYVD